MHCTTRLQITVVGNLDAFGYCQVHWTCRLVAAHMLMTMNYTSSRLDKGHTSYPDILLNSKIILFGAVEECRRALLGKCAYISDVACFWSTHV